MWSNESNIDKDFEARIIQKISEGMFYFGCEQNFVVDRKQYAFTDSQPWGDFSYSKKSEGWRTHPLY